MDNLTSNQWYRGLNRRFDKRARVMVRAGWNYRDGIWTNRPPGFTQGEFTVSNSHLMHAAKRTWQDTLSRMACYGSW